MAPPTPEKANATMASSAQGSPRAAEVNGRVTTVGTRIAVDILNAGIIQFSLFKLEMNFLDIL